MKRVIGIIYAGQIELSPFVKKYTAVMNEENVPYEIVHWNRSGVKMPDDDSNYTFSEQVDRYGRLSGKIIPFFKFRHFAKRIIKSKKYDKLIILTTQTAVMLPDILYGKYKNKYFFDYRDTSYEYIKPYKKFVDSIIEKSQFTAISSPGFKEYLTDKKELTVAHNFQYDYYRDRAKKCIKNNSGKITLGYIGYLREYEYLIGFVEKFGNDERFDFHIHGSGDCLEKLKAFAEKYPNVRVFGAYNECDKMDIVDSFDMICYNYPHSFVNYPAVANKFYDGMIRKKPMFGNSETFSGMLIMQNGLGISLPENEENITDKIYEYYRTFNETEFEENCERVLKRVIDEDSYYTEKIREFVKGAKER